MAKAFDVDTGGTLTTGLWAWYNLEDVNDEFTNGYNLTNANTVAFNAGKIGNAGDTGASNANKRLYFSTTDPGFGATNSACSLAGWFNVTTAPTSGQDHVLFNFQSHTAGSSSDIAYVMKYYNNGGTLQLNFARLKEGVAWQDSLYTQTLTTGTWYHLAITYDNANVRGYFNGSLVTGPTAYNGAGNASYATYVEIFNRAAGQHSSGLADMVGFWNNKALSTTEITDLYNSGSGNAYREPVATASRYTPTPSNLLLLGIS